MKYRKKNKKKYRKNKKKGYYLCNDFPSAKRCADQILQNQSHNAASEIWLASSYAMEEEERVKNQAIGTGVAAVGIGLAIGIAGLMIKKR
mgnify:CR=1 FL=1